MKHAIFVNFTNHPSYKWSADQIDAAKKYGEIEDMTFPMVDSGATSEDVRQLAQKYIDAIIEIHPAAVLCQGEFTLCYSVINGLKEHDIKVLAACSERITEDTPDGKVSKFVFEGFREYK